MGSSGVFLCNTAFQIVLAQVLVRDQQIQADLVQTVGPTETLPYLDSPCWGQVVHVKQLGVEAGGKSPWSWARTKYRLATVGRRIIGFRLPSSDYEKVYLCNDADVTNQILLHHLPKLRSIVYYDDGLSWLGGQLIPDPVLSPGLKRTIKRLLGIYDEGIRRRGRVDAAFVFEPNASVDRVFDFGAVITRQEGYLAGLADRISKGLSVYGQPDYLILTQPFTEEGMCRGMEEVAAVDAFVRSLPPQAGVILKPHPRELAGKYAALMGTRLGFRELDVQDMPYELLHARLQPRCLVGFFSAALLMSQFFHRCRVVSLMEWLPLDMSRHKVLLDRMLNARVEYPRRPVALGRA